MMKCYVVHFKKNGCRYSCRVLAYSVEKAIEAVKSIGGSTYMVSGISEVSGHVSNG